MKKVIVTGAAGFIGSNLVDSLIEDHYIVGIDNCYYGTKKAEMNIGHLRGNRHWEFNTVDIADMTALDNPEFWKDVDIVFHLAAIADVLPSIDNPSPYFSASVLGTHNILECMRKYGVKNIVYSASSSCYGDAEELPTPEDTRPEFLAPYALYKWMAEREIEEYTIQYKINAISLRYFNVYGKRVKTHGSYGIAIGIFLAQHFNGYPICYIGDGMQGRDYIDVRDVVRINKWAWSALEDREGYYNFYNVGTGEIATIFHIVDEINSHSNTRQMPKRPNEALYTQADITKLQNAMGEAWTELITIDEGIRNLLENEKEYFVGCEYPKYEGIIGKVDGF